MSEKSTPKPVAGTERGGRLSAGSTKPKNFALTPESKTKSTPREKSTTGKSQTPVRVPHYLRASTGSCHDFCKYGGRRALEEEEEEEKSGSRLSKKKSGSGKRPTWKDIMAYDALPKIVKPQVVPLVSKKVTVPIKTKSHQVVPSVSKKVAIPTITKPRSEGSAGSARLNLHRQTSLEASSSSTKHGVLTSVKVSSASAKTKVCRPGVSHKENASNIPKIQERKEENVDVGLTGTAGNRNEVDGEPTRTGVGNEVEGGEERTLYVVEPKTGMKCDFDLHTEKPIEEPKPDFKEIIEIYFEAEVEKVETNEVSVSESNCMRKAPLECPLEEITDEPFSENNTPPSPHKEIIEKSEPELSEKNKNSESENETTVRSGSISGEWVEKSEPEIESSEEGEQSIEFESESEAGSGSALTCSIEFASKNEKSKVELSNRRSGSGKQEEKKPYKLKFKPVRVIELKPDRESGPRLLKFRKPRMVGESRKTTGDGRKMSYRKRSGTDTTGSSNVDTKSAGVVLKHQDGSERKEGQNGLFNNVIEETASKLVESKKSKVKALVGAFETVISLQDGKPTSTA